MLGRKNDAALDARLLHTGQDRREVDDELRSGVRYDRQVRIVALGHGVVQFEVDAELFHLCHCGVLFLQIYSFSTNDMQARGQSFRYFINISDPRDNPPHPFFAFS